VQLAVRRHVRLHRLHRRVPHLSRRQHPLRVLLQRVEQELPGAQPRGQVLELGQQVLAPPQRLYRLNTGGYRNRQEERFGMAS
jgi:hypothetical protein